MCFYSTNLNSVWTFQVRIKDFIFYIYVSIICSLFLKGRRYEKFSFYLMCFKVSLLLLQRYLTLNLSRSIFILMWKEFLFWHDTTNNTEVFAKKLRSRWPLLFLILHIEARVYIFYCNRSEIDRNDNNSTNSVHKVGIFSTLYFQNNNFCSIFEWNLTKH